MRVCAISGGVGSARFCAGLARILDPRELTLVVNTGDDERIRGLHICPDIDTVLYHLAAATDWERGWGVVGESFVANERYRELAERTGEVAVDLQSWFALGDRDLATHLLRARLLDAGRSLTDATTILARAMGVEATILPMSDDPAPTTLTTADGEVLDFQGYFVRLKQAPEIADVSFAAAERARPAPGVLDALSEAEMIIVPPSNPMLSIGPILAVPGIRSAIETSEALCVAVSPIVGGKALKGPADLLLASLGHEVSAVGVARLYRGLVDVFVLDAVDADRVPDVAALEYRAVVCDTIMPGPEEAARVAKSVLDNVAG